MVVGIRKLFNVILKCLSCLKIYVYIMNQLAKDTKKKKRIKENEELDMSRLSIIYACVVCNVPYGKQDIERTESL